MSMLNTSTIIDLYNKYKHELAEVGTDIKLFLDKNCNKENRREGLNPQFSDIEAEITYMLIREVNPNNIVEFSPCHGYSSMWLLNAMERNNNGTLYSFDLINESDNYIPDSLKQRRIFTEGDVKANLDKFPDEIDYLFIDSDHSGGFGKWYIESLFPLVKNNVYVSVHDVVKRHPASKKLVYGEAREMIKWLDGRNIPYYSASLQWDVGDLNVSDTNARETIDNYKEENKFVEVNTYGKCQRNSAIFFRMEA